MQYKVQKVTRETDDAVSLILDTQGEFVSYEAGQFITFIFKNRNDEEERRSYSISSSPEQKEPLMVTIKRIPNGSYSRQVVDRIKEGDVLNGLAPAGFFTLPSAITAQDAFVFFAAGSGIAPIFSQIKNLLATGIVRNIILVYSNRSKQDTIFYDALVLLSEKYANRFFVHFFFSDSPIYTQGRISSGIITALMHRYFQHNFTNVWCYLCGPFQYMLMITLVLRGIGVADTMIKREQFVIEKSLARQQPPDTEKHRVEAIINGKSYSWSAQYPDTVLSAAKKVGIPMPYSCESGQCGACSATCVKGEVWMYRNEVLMEDELESGRVLTCTGYVVGGDVELRF